MHIIDEAIYSGTMTHDLLTEHAAMPLPAPGHSYWGDRMHEGHEPLVAARLAARDMGTALAALAALGAL